MRVVILIILVIVLSALAIGVFALPLDDISLDRMVMSGGGQPATGTGLTLNGTLGEPIASPLTVGSTFGLSSGFWQLSPLEYVYLPLVQRDA